LPVFRFKRIDSFRQGKFYWNFDCSYKTCIIKMEES